MRKLVQVWLVCVVVFVLLIGAASAIGQARGGAIIAFTSGRVGSEVINVMDIGLGIVRRQSLAQPPSYTPTFSSDGTLAYISDGQLHYIEEQSTVVIETPPNPDHPKWSPDGTRIAFRATNDHAYFTLYIWNRYSGAIDQVTDQSSSVGIFEWSPDSTRLAYVTNSSTTFGIHILHVESGEIHTIIDVDPRLDQLAWSPDGTRLAFTTPNFGRTGIVVWDSRNDTIQSLIRPFEYATSPAWLPNGEWLAYTAYRVGIGRDIFIIHVESGEVRNLTNSPTNEFPPSWSPDGTYLAFMDIYDLYVIDIATGEVRNLTNNGGRWVALDFAWRP